MRRVRVSSHHSPVHRLGDSQMTLSPKFRLALPPPPTPSPALAPWDDDDASHIPGLPENAALSCLLRLHVAAHGVCRLMCRRWRRLLADRPRFLAQRRALGLRSPCLFTLAFRRRTGKIH
ncbi:hypothetical protein U9M48_010133 [Paspalum notatum var. saurae]|uniref:F-box domain-containing protein n=1 Tax=Paspalum notatum var. saurae TaxID=547442 RepID=A0AAQ3SSU1_PASNO